MTTKHFEEKQAVCLVKDKGYLYTSVLPTPDCTGSQFAASLLQEGKVTEQQLKAILINGIDLYYRGKVGSRISAITSGKDRKTVSNEELAAYLSSLTPEQQLEALQRLASGQGIPQERAIPFKMVEGEDLKIAREAWKKQRARALKAAGVDEGDEASEG
jgi:hypothetical protein